MLKKLLFIAVILAAVCAWGIAPMWSDASAQTIPPIDGTPIDDVADAPDSDPSDPNADLDEDFVNDSDVPEDQSATQTVALDIRPSGPIFTRGSVFIFIARVVNIGTDALNNVIVRFVVPAFTTFQPPVQVQSAAVGDYTCQNGGVAGDTCAYEASASLSANGAVEFDIPLMIETTYPESGGIDPLSITGRADAQNLATNKFVAARSAADAVDDEIESEEIPENFEENLAETVDETFAPSESEDISLAPSEGEGSPSTTATVDTNPDGTSTVTLPVGFINDSDGTLDGVTLSIPLSEGQSLPEDSPWQVITLPDGSTVAVFNVGSLESGESAELPFVYNSEDVDAGEAIELPTRLDATNPDGTAITLAGTVTQTPVLASKPIPDTYKDNLGGTTDEAFAPSESADLALAPSEGEGSPEAEATVSDNPNGGAATVTLPVGFTNTSAETLSDVVLTVPLGADETLPDGSQWNVITLPDGSRVAAFNLGSLGAGETAEIPFVFNSNNVAGGSPVELQTRLDATKADGTAVSLADTIVITPEDTTPTTPTALDQGTEPTEVKIFLPLINQQ